MPISGAAFFQIDTPRAIRRDASLNNNRPVGAYSQKGSKLKTIGRDTSPVEYYEAAADKE